MYYTSKKTFQLALAEKIGQIINSKQVNQNVIPTITSVGYELTLLSEDVKVGDKVYSKFHGKGEVIELMSEGKLQRLSEKWGYSFKGYFIVVKFEGFWAATITYNKDGFCTDLKDLDTRIFSYSIKT